MAGKASPSPTSRGPSIDSAHGFGPETSLLFGLVRFLNYVGQEFEEKYAPPLKISIAEWRVMIVIGSRPNISAVEVATATGYSEMHVSRIVRQLVAKGDVARSRSPADRRKTALTLPRKGRRIYETMLSNTKTAESRVLSSLSLAEVKRLRQMIWQLNEQFGPFGRTVR